jgi:hypothetical protein
MQRFLLLALAAALWKKPERAAPTTAKAAPYGPSRATAPQNGPQYQWALPPSFAVCEQLNRIWTLMVYLIFPHQVLVVQTLV